MSENGSFEKSPMFALKGKMVTFGLNPRVEVSDPGSRRARMC